MQGDTTHTLQSAHCKPQLTIFAAKQKKGRLQAQNARQQTYRDVVTFGVLILSTSPCGMGCTCSACRGTMHGSCIPYHHHRRRHLSKPQFHRHPPDAISLGPTSNSARMRLKYLSLTRSTRGRSCRRSNTSRVLSVIVQIGDVNIMQTVEASQLHYPPASLVQNKLGADQQGQCSAELLGFYCS